ncbi:hypothetical protein O9X98_06055 [Agrobacterium salinitolerans]|nr:hypothetical protein [Agrobacterium salinitolerans]
MKLKALLALAILACPTAAFAEDPIYVVRPHIPGVAAGVLPQNAFSADPGTNPSSPGSGLPYHYVSVRYHQDLGKVPGYTATVAIGGSYVYKSPVAPSPNPYCSIWIPEDFSAMTYFDRWRQDDGGFRIEFPKADKWGYSEWRKNPGIFAFYIDCQARDENYNVIERKFETLTITTTN